LHEANEFIKKKRSVTNEKISKLIKMSRPRSVIQISDQKYKDQSTKNLGIQAQNSALYSGQHLVESYMKTR